MRARLWLLLCALPLCAFGGCLLPSYENASGRSDADGGEAAGGTGWMDAGAGGVDEGGAPGPGGQSSGGAPSAPELQSDTYVLQQGRSLSVSAQNGVLSNDSGELRVTAFDDADAGRDVTLDAQLDVAEDGSVTFKPAAAFFGRYVARYTATDAAGQAAESTVTFVVQPLKAALGAVERGAGGVVLQGSGADGVGAAIAALGDVNDDGIDDFAIGAPGAAGASGAVYVVFGREDLSGFELSALPDDSKEARYAVITGDANAPIGSYVTGAGRFTSDDAADIAIGSPEADTEDGAITDAGRVFVIPGGAELSGNLALGSDTFSFFSAEAGESLGTLVTSGDYDGDGKIDLIAGVYPGGLTLGGVTVLLDHPAKSLAIDSAQRTMKDTGVYRLPQALAMAGDVNDDGTDDIVVSSRAHIALVYGQSTGAIASDIGAIVADESGILRQRPSPTGIAAVAGLGDVNGDAKSDFAYCDRPSSGAAPLCQVFFRTLEAGVDTLEAGDWTLSGFVGDTTLPLLSPGADLNDDGFADVLIADASSAYVVFGRDAGFGDVKVSSLGSDGFSLSLSDAQRLSAISVIGDVNGDGYGDFALGVADAGGGAGRVYVVFGGPFSADQR